MIPTQMFRRHLSATIGIIVICILIAGLANHFIMEASRDSFRRDRVNHILFFAHAIDGLNTNDRSAAIQTIQSWDQEGFPIKMVLLGEEGQVIYPKDFSLPFDWSSIEKPSAEYDYVMTTKKGGPPGPPSGIIRLKGVPPHYFYFEPSDFAQKRGPPSGPPPGPLGGMFFITLGLLLTAILVGVGVSQSLLFKTLGQKVKLADSVISELQKGNLKARFPVHKMDEFGTAMSRFNKMAEEIERLVEQLKTTEKSRTTLLQELAHDLRTPIASLKSLLETLASKGKQIEPKLHDELTTLALKEAEYFERLIEDLLVLAQISEPKYQVDQSPVVVNELLEDEVDAVEALFRSNKKTVKAQLDFPTDKVHAIGDSHLLRRLFRNALNNAFSFATSEVLIQLRLLSENQIEIIIQDDGPGLSSEALTSFGERRISRVLGTHAEGRLSVGLGSVIMKAIAHTHRGEVTAMNTLNENGASKGARIIIRLSA